MSKNAPKSCCVMPNSVVDIYQHNHSGITLEPLVNHGGSSLYCGRPAAAARVNTDGTDGVLVCAAHYAGWQTVQTDLRFRMLRYIIEELPV